MIPSPPNNRTIDFRSNIPYYVQLIDVMKELINAKVWKPGDRIAGEVELCQMYGVSRTVVRQALRELELDGFVTRRKGKGTFIAERKISESLAQRLTGFHQDMVERGLKPVTQVLHHQVVPCTEKVANYLQIAPGAQVIDIKRLRFVEDAPIQLVNSYLPYELCPSLADVDLTNRSLYEFLESTCGLFIAHGRRIIEAVAANEEESKLLKVERGAPLVLLNSISYLEDGRPIEYYHAVHRGDRARFEVELVRFREPAQAAAADRLPQSNAFIR